MCECVSMCVCASRGCTPTPPHPPPPLPTPLSLHNCSWRATPRPPTRLPSHPPTAPRPNRTSAPHAVGCSTTLQCQGRMWWGSPSATWQQTCRWVGVGWVGGWVGVGGWVDGWVGSRASGQGQGSHAHSLARVTSPPSLPPSLPPPPGLWRSSVRGRRAPAGRVAARQARALHPPPRQDIEDWWVPMHLGGRCKHMGGQALAWPHAHPPTCKPPARTASLRAAPSPRAPPHRPPPHTRTLQTPPPRWPSRAWLASSWLRTCRGQTALAQSSTTRTFSQWCVFRCLAGALLLCLFLGGWVLCVWMSGWVLGRRSAWRLPTLPHFLPPPPPPPSPTGRGDVRGAGDRCGGRRHRGCCRRGRQGCGGGIRGPACIDGL